MENVYSFQTQIGSARMAAAERRSIPPLRQGPEAPTTVWLFLVARRPAVLCWDVHPSIHPSKEKHQRDNMKASPLTRYQLREELVVAVDDVDRQVPGRLQEERATLRRQQGQLKPGPLITAMTAIRLQRYANLC